ncbi:FkbM family methyltransferase [Thalassococcus sp. S3]|uniref:FkbM family methyltransferase n=1 Tax=Thalassococcus sp. S3 TaxID=2017482 RepID=UPI0010242DD4|nr:FkbM family methyltransferase [Thalassococcus sp. S3]QBF31318.1 hypothetical protein CFI11_08815 [Thalassococcus sp. S3]
MRIFKGAERAAKALVPKGWHKYFRASRYELLMERLAPVDLIVHVGAHWAEDAAHYEACGAKTVLWIEADPGTFRRLREVLAERTGATRHIAECALVSSREDRQVSFNRFNGDGASSSVYRSAPTRANRFPGSHETGEVLALKTRTLDAVMASHGVDASAAGTAMLVIDVQGHELEVLRGLDVGLTQFDLCKCEVSRIPMYQNAPLFPDIDAHFRSFGFRLASHRYALVPSHGDVLYQRA